MAVPAVATPAMVATLAAILAATPAATLGMTVQMMVAPMMVALITAHLLFLQPVLPPLQLLALPQLDQELLQLPLQTSLLLSQCC
jgi:hypothetical protein